MTYSIQEQSDILLAFNQMLRAVIADGGKKRAKGLKVHWTIDIHEPSFYRHLDSWEAGSLIDKDSGAHPLVHLAARALMMAFQETHPWEETSLLKEKA